MTVPPPTDDDLADVPADADFEESFWRQYAVHVRDYRADWVDDLLDDRGVAALVAELADDDGREGAGDESEGDGTGEGGDDAR